MISSRHMLRKRLCQKKQVDWLCSGKTKKVQVPTLWKEQYAWDHRQKLLKHWRAENTTKSQKTNSKAICLHEKMPPKSPTSDPCQLPDCRLDDSPCAAGLAFKNCTASAREACKSTSVKRLNKNATQSFPRCHPQLCVRIGPQRCHWRAPNVRGETRFLSMQDFIVPSRPLSNRNESPCTDVSHSPSGAYRKSVVVQCAPRENKQFSWRNSELPTLLFFQGAFCLRHLPCSHAQKVALRFNSSTSSPFSMPSITLRQSHQHTSSSSHTPC